MKINESRADILFNVLNYFFLAVMTLVCLYPLYLVLISSISDPSEVAAGNVFLFPKGFSLEAYKAVFQNSDIVRGYWNTLIYTLAGTMLNLLLTIPCAYALSKKDFFGGSLIMKLIVFTMYFSGGLVPTFILMRDLHLLNTRWVILLSGGVAATNLIIARTFFSSGVPSELEEAATIDGCSTLQTFFKIVLPLSKSMLGVITLYYVVARWNNYTSSLYYQPLASELYPLQMVLRQMLITMQTAVALDNPDAEMYANLFNQIKYSVIVVASVPLLVIYPFIQKFFEKGVMLGSVKG